MRLPQPPVLLITDRRRARAPLDQMAAAAFAAGCRWLSLREKDLAPAERLILLRRLRALGREKGAIVTVHDDLAAARMADGIHLPRDGDPAKARRLLGLEALIGLSAHDRREAQAAARGGADYVTVSPVFASAGKPGYGPVMGLEELGEIARGLSIPVIALGGVGPGNAADCLASGASGIAVMGAVMAATDPGAVMARLTAIAE